MGSCKNFSLSLSIIFISFLLFFSGKCTPDSLTKWNEDDESTNAGATTSGGAKIPTSHMALYEITNPLLSYKLHKMDTSTEDGPTANVNPDTACEISDVETGDNKSRDIMCWLDVGENDLYFNGLKFNLFVRANKCEYITFSPYYFYRYQPGTTAKNNADALNCNSVYDSSMCRFNYTDVNLSCDEGSVTIQDKDTSDPPDPDSNNGCFPVSGTHPGTTTQCGGKWKNCLAGPLLEMSSLVWPIRTEMSLSLAENKNKDFDKIWQFSAPITKNYVSNMYLSNYMAFCGGSGSNYQYNTAGLIAYATTLPNGFAASIAAVQASISGVDPINAGNTTYPTNPFYTFECLNKAGDLKARIRVVVREWDRNFDPTSLNLIVAKPQEGNLMDSTSAEDDPFDDSYFNDYDDWDDMYTSSTTPPGCRAIPLMSSPMLDYPEADL
ncbi:MAG: hypothetical protein HQK51_08765 [Oligoflexia bacterium]|nr:hypothetical protein [Oligoflexia bacterium]